MDVAVVIGTRPEAIKMAPVVAALDRAPGLRPVVILTGQHSDLVDPVLEFFGVAADLRLSAMGAGGPTGVLSRALAALDAAFAADPPAAVAVHGDTTSALAGALAAFHRRIPVAHVEAGLRTGDLERPFPEEMNRQVIDVMAALHFAPTPAAAAALVAEGRAASGIHMVGNTAIDALLEGISRLGPEEAAPDGRREVLVTLHRREGLGPGMAGCIEAIARLAARGDVHVTMPVHPNPEVRKQIVAGLSELENVDLVAPMPYPAFLGAMRRAHLILTDSGGIQEEAPSLAVPVVVLREKTERPEALASGAARLAGFDAGRIVAICEEILDDAAIRDRLARTPNPFGDGRAADRIAAAIAAHLGAA